MGARNPGNADEVLRKVFSGPSSSLKIRQPGSADAVLRAVYDAVNGALKVTLSGGIYALVHAGVPVDGVTGVGLVGEGEFLWDSTNKVPYVNIGTMAAPVWRGLGLIVP